MSDKMTPLSFESLMHSLLREYKEKKSFLEVPVTRNGRPLPIGPAAGPHTQLAGNIVAAYGAGANCFELKTVQVLEGDALGIVKPCIYVATEVFNTEWSSELTVLQAEAEYVKAYLLLKVLTREFSLGGPEDFSFIMSVGYDLQGIQSPKIDSFIQHLMNANQSEEWQKDMAYLKAHLSLFEHVDQAYLDQISPVVSDTMALSTMHGCESTEIERIASYLLQEKGLNVYVKMNPTLLGKDAIEDILKEMGYGHLTFDPHIFEADMDFESACGMIERLQKKAHTLKKTFGVKLTNTFPVKCQNQELTGETMYLSGAALYPIAVGVAAKLSEHFKGQLPISYSGGADDSNIVALLESGLSPVTVSSYLLKPKGYGNIHHLVKAVQGSRLLEVAKVSRGEEVLLNDQTTHVAEVQQVINVPKLKVLAIESIKSSTYHYQPIKVFPRKEAYSPLCAACNNCVDICPNRANRRVTCGGKKAVIHLDALCNECGACSFYCIKGHDPYKEKFNVPDSEMDLDTILSSGTWEVMRHEF